LKVFLIIVIKFNLPVTLFYSIWFFNGLYDFYYGNLYLEMPANKIHQHHIDKIFKN